MRHEYCFAKRRLLLKSEAASLQERLLAVYKVIVEAGLSVRFVKLDRAEHERVLALIDRVTVIVSFPTST